MNGLLTLSTIFWNNPRSLIKIKQTKTKNTRKPQEFSVYRSEDFIIFYLIQDGQYAVVKYTISGSLIDIYFLFDLTPFNRQ